MISKEKRENSNEKIIPSDEPLINEELKEKDNYSITN